MTSLQIYNTELAPGDHSIIRIPVGRVPSGNQMQIRVHAYRSRQPGPVVLILAGVHGDEVNGIEIVRQAISSGLFERLRSGTVLAIPVLNVYGFINFSREVPDGKDINRSFPGNRSGSLASRVAGMLTREILPHVNFGVDFHTGGQQHFNYPQIRYSSNHEPSRTLAADFGAPVMLGVRPVRRSLRRYAVESGIPMLVFEGGENLCLDDFCTQVGYHGLERLLIKQGLLPGPIYEQVSRSFDKSSWMRAAQAGMFRPYKRAGMPVRKGEPIGRVADPYGGKEYVIKARRDGLLIGHNNGPVVNQGDALFHLAYQS